MTEIISVLAGILKTSVVTIYKTIDTTLDNIKGVLAGTGCPKKVSNKLDRGRKKHLVSRRNAEEITNRFL